VALVAAVGVLAPALTILLDFARSTAIETAAALQTPAHTVAAHHRGAHRASNPGAAAEPQNQDSLTSLRVRPPLKETSVYRLTASDNNRPDADPTEDKLGWSEPAPRVRTVSSTVLSAAGQIPISKIPHRNDHDRDDH
jgi:hypothetical protein